MTRALRRLAALLLVLLALAAGAVGEGAEGAIRYGVPPEGFAGLEARFLDVGVGDSIYLRCGDESLLVDGGLEADGDRIAAYFAAEGMSGVTYMLNTHCHNDHLNGLVRLLRLGFTASKGFAPYAPDRRIDGFADYVAWLKKRGASYRMAAEGDTIALGGAVVEVYRQTDAAALRLGNENALVLRVRYGERSLLLPADVGGATQRKLALRLGDALRADVVKSAHHGMALFVDEWLEAVQPAFAVCTGRRGKAAAFARQMERRGVDMLFAPSGVVHLMTDGLTWYIWQTGHMAKPDEAELLFPTPAPAA